MTAWERGYLATLKFDDDYVELLRNAMRRNSTRAYVVTRLGESLDRIAISSDCVSDVIALVSKLIDPKVDGAALAERVDKFQTRWRPHLLRSYLSGYEKTRWDFVEQFVLTPLRGVPFGRCLDVGCGRGCITAALSQQPSVIDMVGVDEADFSSEWRERMAVAPRCVRFDRVSVGQLPRWLEDQGRFDTAFMFYVLHHSDEYWAAHTLRALRERIKTGGRLVVVEDALVVDAPPKSDPFGLIGQWKSWSTAEPLYCLTPAFDSQAILDFVAVQLLAGFSDVHMPCHYRSAMAWVSLFEKIGFKTVKQENIGFPDGRDIDVPQALFVLET
jgi:SAM-dependent methyltransferase